MLVQHYMSIFEQLMFTSEQKLFENGHIVLNKYSKIPRSNIGIFIALHYGEYKFKEFSDQLWSFIDDNKVDKLIIDIRRNFGGTNSVFQPFIHQLIQHPKLNHKENLFVLTSPKTFSAAIHLAFWLDDLCNPTFVGMPTAAGAIHYADPNFLKLPNSEILFWVSTNLWQLTAPTDKRLWLEPDIKIEFNSSDYFNLKDVVLNKILLKNTL